MNTPAHLSDDELENLIERGMLPSARTTEPGHAEHPTASWLYRKWRVGGAILTKDEAYRIGNELDRLHARVLELEGKRS